MKGTSFYWKHKNVLFVSVDVFEEGESNQGKIRAGVTGKQLEWLKGVFDQNKDVKHIIVMGHAPCLGPVRKWSSSGLMIEEGRASHFWQLMKKYQVDLYLAGEVHAITCTERDGIQQIAHGGLVGYNTRTNYLMVDVYSDRLELAIKEIDLVPSGEMLWQPGSNRPLEKVDITPGMKERGFIPVGKLTIDKSGERKRYNHPLGYFLKKFETSNEQARPHFKGSNAIPTSLPRINLNGMIGEFPENPVFKKTEKPNLIVFLTDDQGYADVGCYGAKDFSTPNMDQMAREGIRFTDFYAAPTCSPSRASLLTGCYGQRVGITKPLNGPTVGLHPDEITLAEVLKKEGYATAIIGKWHLGLPDEMSPVAQGFDYFSGIPLSQIRHGPTEHTDDPKAYYKRQWKKMGVGIETEVEYAPDENRFTQRCTEEALNFIRQNHRKPFFLYLSQAQVHKEVLASKEFQGRSPRGRYGDACEELDWSLGEVIKLLKNLGIDEQTLLVFTSDK